MDSSERRHLLLAQIHICDGGDRQAVEPGSIQAGCSDPGRELKAADWMQAPGSQTRSKPASCSKKTAPLITRKVTADKTIAESVCAFLNECVHCITLCVVHQCRASVFFCSLSICLSVCSAVCLQLFCASRSQSDPRPRGKLMK